MYANKAYSHASGSTGVSLKILFKKRRENDEENVT